MTVRVGLDGTDVLVTGGGGQLASDLSDRLRGRCRGHAPTREQLDVTDQRALEDAFARTRPAVVFNCAAFHNVDVCEREEDRSFEVNARAVKRIAELCAGAGTRLVHLSTNYVFSGDGDQPNTEADLPRPGSVYAISKLAGEHTALAYTDALVVRTSGLYGSGGNESKGGNFVQRMVARADAQGALEVVADQRLTPTYTVDLAEALIAAVDRGLGGLLHLTNSGACSWHEFTLAIMEIAGIGVPVKPTETLRAPGGVDRPLNGVLSCANAVQAGVPPLRHWRTALDAYMSSVGLAAAPADGHERAA